MMVGEFAKTICKGTYRDSRKLIAAGLIINWGGGGRHKVT